jgi:hypothetical protein
MALKDTANAMMKLLDECAQNLHKCASGNKAAAQRVRTGSIKLEKVAKLFRKESVAAERKGGGKRAPAKAKAKAPAKKAAKKGKSKKK